MYGPHRELPVLTHSFPTRRPSDLLKTEYRRNTLNAETGVVTVSDRRAQAMAQTAEYYVKLYSSDPELRKTRSNFAMKEDTLPSAQRRHDLHNFYSCTAWAASTQRPPRHPTPTHTCPHPPPPHN